MKIEITKDESIALLEEMQEDLNKICPHCNGIIIWRRGKIKRKTKALNSYKYTCRECGKYFTLNPIIPKIKGDVANFIINNVNIISSRDLSKLIYKYFKISISSQAIWIFKKMFKSQEVIN